MTSPLVPQATLMLDGKEYTLRMDLNALSDFESMTGKSIMRGGLTDINNLELSDARGLLWACMVQDDESLTIRQVGRMIHMGNLGEITEVIQKLVAGAMPDAQEEAEGSDPLPTTSPSPQTSGGFDSGPQPDKTSE
jgi:hypothetical protein